MMVKDKVDKDIEKMLRDFSNKKKHLDRIANELEMYSGISAEDVIQAMVFARHFGDKVQESGPSDRTARIALMYKEIQQSTDAQVIGELYQEYKELKKHVCWLEGCIKTLSSNLPEIITAMFIEETPWGDICDKYNMSKSTLGRCRQQAIAEIRWMYDRKARLERKCGLGKSWE